MEGISAMQNTHSWRQTRTESLKVKSWMMKSAYLPIKGLTYSVLLIWITEMHKKQQNNQSAVKNTE